MRNKSRLDIIIENEIRNVFQGINVNEATQIQQRAQQDVMDAVRNANTEAREHMNNIANHVGVNMQGDSPRITRNGVETNDGQKYSYEQFLKNITKKLVDACEKLRTVIKPNGGVQNDVMYAPDIDNYTKNKKPQDMDLKGSAELMKCKDLLDLLSLSYLYDTANAQQLVTKDKRYNIIYDKIEDLPTDKFFNMVKDSFDLSYATPKDIVNWAASGTRYGDLSKSDEKYDEKIASGDYVQHGDTWFRKGSYGAKYGQKGDWLDANGQPVDANMFAAIKADYYRNLLEKVINAVYGMDLQCPNVPFTYGNSKLPKSSLVINFTSAHRCPAWNECLVKYACYARTSEHGYKDLFAKNKRLSVMWEGSRYDEQLKKALFNLIRVYVVNLKKLLEKANANYRMTNNLGAKASTPYSGDEFYNTVLEKGFGGLPEEVKEIIKNDSDVKYIQDIRLNEEGDFIGQWLLDAVDEFATELNEIGVKVAAYTCRNLNFDGIKNIIINASKENIGTHHDGSTANAIARRFFAVSEDIYNSMDETYATQIDANGKPIGEPGIPTYIANEKLFGDSKGRIIPYPQPLYIDGKPTGQLYYKCPCGRGKHETKKKNGKPTKAEELFNSYSNPNNLERLKQGKNAQLEGVNCYDCRMCYSEKLQESKYPVVVLVQVHSANSDLFKSDDENTQQQHIKMGRSQNYAVNHKKYFESYNRNKSLIKENAVLDPSTSDEAVRQIAKYGEQSVQTHMKQLKKQVQTEAKQQFFNKYKQLFG